MGDGGRTLGDSSSRGRKHQARAGGMFQAEGTAGAEVGRRWAGLKDEQGDAHLSSGASEGKGARYRSPQWGQDLNPGLGHGKRYPERLSGVPAPHLARRFSSCVVPPPGSLPQLDFCELHLSLLPSPSPRFLSRERDTLGWQGQDPKPVLSLQMRKPRLREGKQPV